MAKARLVPVFFDPGRDEDFDRQLDTLKRLLPERADFLEPVALGKRLPEADAVVFPQLLGEAYRSLAAFKAIRLPILIVTSEFGTESMWDWEIIAYLRSEGVWTVAPYDLEQTRAVCSVLCAARELRGSRFLVFQDNPGEGAQASIFKRFYWWEKECSRRMKKKFGLSVVKRSLRQLAQEAERIPDEKARQLWRQCRVPTRGIGNQPISSAVKLYAAIKRHLDADPSVLAVGVNCLNESHFCDTTPCLAWSLLFEQRRLIWGCEADTLSMLTMYLLERSLDVPLMMTNLYPFLMGQAALKHEKIKAFPKVDRDPQDCVLVAHCGYFGLVPKCFASEWKLRAKVLAIVDDNAIAIDARLPLGDVTLAKLDATMNRLSVVEGRLEEYAVFPGSDCRNGGVIRVRDGHALMANLASHHYVLLAGHEGQRIRFISQVLGLAVDEV